MKRRPAIVFLVLTLFATDAAWADDELVDNPTYVSWAKLATGSSITLGVVTTTPSGQTITSETTQTLIEINPDVATTEIKNKMEVMGTVREVPPQKVSIRAKVPKQQAEGANMPAGASGTSEPAGNEKVTVAGKEYDCKVINFTGETNGMKSSGKMWRCDVVPGGLVRMIMNVEGAQSMSLKMELKAINVK